MKKNSQNKFGWKNFRLNRKWKVNYTAYLMIFPSIFLLILFVIYPLFRGLYISFFRWDGLSEMEWIGLNNYKFIFRDKVYWCAVKNTLIFSLGVTIIKNVVAFLLALLMNQNIRGKTIFRTAAFLPVTLAFVVVGVLWSWIYNPTFGLLNDLLKSLGLESLIRGWLSDPDIALFSVMIVDIWKWTGFHMVLYIAGLQGIDKEYYEAADLDGAGKLQKIMHITIPLINQVAAVSIIMSLIGAIVNNYDVVYVMTRGGPYHSTEIALTWIVHTAFIFGSFGKANAMSIVLFFITIILGIFQVIAMTRQRYEA